MNDNKKVLLALSPEFLEQIDYVARCEHRTRSDLFREAIRRYLANFKELPWTYARVDENDD